MSRAGSLAAGGRDEEDAGEYRESLALNPATAFAQFGLAGYHVVRGELDQALALCEKLYALAPLPQSIGMLTGLLKRTGGPHRRGGLLGKLQPGHACGAPRGLAVYRWVLREFESAADWLEEAIDRRGLLRRLKSAVGVRSAGGS